MKPKSLPSLMASALVTVLAGQGLAAPLWPGGKDERVSRPDAHWVAIADELSRSFVGVSGDQCSLPPITDAGNRFDLRTVRVLRVASPTRTAMMVLTTALACDAKEIHNDPKRVEFFAESAPAYVGVRHVVLILDFASRTLIKSYELEPGDAIRKLMDLNGDGVPEIVVRREMKKPHRWSATVSVLAFRGGELRPVAQGTLTQTADADLDVEVESSDASRWLLIEKRRTRVRSRSAAAQTEDVRRVEFTIDRCITPEACLIGDGAKRSPHEP